FLFSHVELIRMLGLGLSVAVVLDATLVRLALVPALMTLAGRWNWWLPGPLARLERGARASGRGPDQRRASCNRLAGSNTSPASPGASNDQPPTKAKLRVPTPAEAACTCAARAGPSVSGSKRKVRVAVALPWAGTSVVPRLAVAASAPPTRRTMAGALTR